MIFWGEGREGNEERLIATGLPRIPLALAWRTRLLRRMGEPTMFIRMGVSFLERL